MRDWFNSKTSIFQIENRGANPTISHMEKECILKNEYNLCKGNVVTYNLFEFAYREVKSKNYKQNLCDYHIDVKSFPIATIQSL